MKRHQEALIHAKKATRKSIKIIVNEIILIFCYYLCIFSDNIPGIANNKRGET